MAEALIRAGKQFDSFFYPNEHHGVRYRYHLQTMITNFVLEHLYFLPINPTKRSKTYGTNEKDLRAPRGHDAPVFYRNVGALKILSHAGAAGSLHFHSTSSPQTRH